MTSIYLPKSLTEAYQQGRVRAAVIKTRKHVPTTGTPLQIVAGSWGKGTTLGTETCRAVRYITRVEKGYWAYGTLTNRQTLSRLDMKQLSADCGMTEDELDSKFATQKAGEPLLRVSW